mgnify:FL=1
MRYVVYLFKTQCVTIKGGFVDKKTEKRVFYYTILLTNLKIWLSLSLSLFEVVKGP